MNYFNLFFWGCLQGWRKRMLEFHWRMETRYKYWVIVNTRRLTNQISGIELNETTTVLWDVFIFPQMCMLMAWKPKLNTVFSRSLFQKTRIISPNLQAPSQFQSSGSHSSSTALLQEILIHKRSANTAHKICCQLMKRWQTKTGK